MLYMKNKGPMDGQISNPVDPDAFLSACDRFVPQATLSIGWTTSATGEQVWCSIIL